MFLNFGSVPWILYSYSIILTTCYLKMMLFHFSNKFDNVYTKQSQIEEKSQGLNYHLDRRKKRWKIFALEEIKSFRSLNDSPAISSSNLRFYIHTSNLNDLLKGVQNIQNRFPEYFISDSGEAFRSAVQLLFIPEVEKKKKQRRRVKVTVSESNLVSIYFSQKVDAFFALGRLMIVAKYAPFNINKNRQSLIAAGMEFEVDMPMEELGCKIDTSSGGVLSVKSLQDLTISLSLYGYCKLIIYMEDTYAVDNEPFFGYLQKRFTYEDFVLLSNTAKSVGIEIIPSILLMDDIKSLQNWPVYDSMLKAPPDIDEKYDFLYRMLMTLSEPLKLKRIQISIGDKTHAHFVQNIIAACVRHAEELDRKCFDIEIQYYSSHLRRIVDITKGLNLIPVFYIDSVLCLKKQNINRVKFPEDCKMDSETFLSLNEALGESEIELIHTNYASPESVLSEKVNSVSSLLDNHRSRDHKRTMGIALSLWTWNRFWVALHWSMNMMESGVESARKNGLKFIYVTAWSHDGSEVSLVSIEAALAFFSELVHAKKEESSRNEILQKLDESFKVFFRRPALFTDILEACALDQPSKFPVGWGTTNLAKWLTWEDPLLTHLYPQIAETNMIAHYKTLTNILERKISQFLRQQRILGSEFDLIDFHPLSFPTAVARFLHRKLAFYKLFTSAYESGDKQQLAKMLGRTTDGGKLSETGIFEELTKSLNSLHLLHHRIWMLEFDPLGWAKIDSRYGVLKIRLESTGNLILSYLQDETFAIREMKSYFFQRHMIHAEEVFSLPLITWNQATFSDNAE